MVDHLPGPGASLASAWRRRADLQGVKEPLNSKVGERRDRRALVGDGLSGFVGAGAYDRVMRSGESAGPATAWSQLRARVLSQADGLRVPPPRGRQTCRCCHGPAGPGRRRCFQCELHAESAPGMLADAVVPVAYAARGGPHARDLWLYKSGRRGGLAAAARLRALLLVFLRDHGRCVWRRAGMSAPTHVCVVPSGRGRGEPHPLQGLVAPYLALPWARLALSPHADPWARDLDPGRFHAARPIGGAAVLLLDDTWTSGASAQSAALALRRAGARRVAVVVLARRLPHGPAADATGFRPDLCAAHVAGSGGQ